jgi:hypothetical protein
MGNGIGNEIGETVAAGFCDGATPPVLSDSFGVLSLARSAKGRFTATLFNQIDPGCCVVECNAVSAGNIATANEGGIDTDSLKHFAVTDAAGADADGGFYFTVKRTRYTP